MNPSWHHLLELAEAEVEASLQELPTELQGPARALPILFQPRPGADLTQDGLDPDVLGLFVGEPRENEEDGRGGLPPQIILFLENLWAFSSQEEEIYLEEVRTTFMHELGHYLGLDEDDLEERGLE